MTSVDVIMMLCALAGGMLYGIGYQLISHLAGTEPMPQTSTESHVRRRAGLTLFGIVAHRPGDHAVPVGTDGRAIDFPADSPPPLKAQ